MNIFINNRYRKIYNNKKSFYVLCKKEQVDITDYFKKNGDIKKGYAHLIQQKSKKVVGGGGNILVLSTFNVYTWNGYNMGRSNFDTKFKGLIADKGVELLLTQEDYYQDEDNNETVKAYSKNIKEFKGSSRKPSRFNFNSCITTTPSFYGAVPRNAIIIEDRAFGITIANLHLEGGRFIDTELYDSTFQTYLEIKLDLLNKLLALKQTPDIILGDFNSVYCKDPDLLEKMYLAQIVYYNSRKHSLAKQQGSCEAGETGEEHISKAVGDAFTKHIGDDYGLKPLGRCPRSKVVKISCKKTLSSNEKTLSIDNIVSWNNAPFALLSENGYIYVEPTNIRAGAEVNPANSRGKNVIDHIWVKASLYERFSFNAEIYDGFGNDDSDLLYGGVSDHKPVILSIQMKEAEATAPATSSEAEDISPLLPLAKRTRRGSK
jgi:hypothetical protein